uniref:Secreted protein n=1 Tax=Ditylenchus dipsaci TaxID=166011 RepID=A0A915E2S4_9BILA
MEALFRILLVLLATAEKNAIGSEVVSNSHQEQYWRARATSKTPSSSSHHLYSCEELCQLCCTPPLLAGAAWTS